MKLEYDEFQFTQDWVKRQLASGYTDDSGKVLSEDELWNIAPDNIDFTDYYIHFSEEFGKLIQMNKTHWWHITRRGVSWRNLSGTFISLIKTYNDFHSRYLSNLSDWKCVVNYDGSVIEVTITDHDAISITTMKPIGFDVEDLEKAINHLSLAVEYAIALNAEHIRKHTMYFRYEQIADFERNLDGAYESLGWNPPAHINSRSLALTRAIAKFNTISNDINISGYSDAFARLKKEFEIEFGESGKHLVTGEYEVSGLGKKTIQFWSSARRENLLLKCDRYARSKFPGREIKLIKFEYE